MQAQAARWAPVASVHRPARILMRSPPLAVAVAAGERSLATTIYPDAVDFNFWLSFPCFSQRGYAFLPPLGCRIAGVCSASASARLLWNAGMLSSASPGRSGRRIDANAAVATGDPACLRRTTDTAITRLLIWQLGLRPDQFCYGASTSHAARGLPMPSVTLYA